MAKNKLTKQMVIDDVMAIIRPSQVKKNGDDRGAALIQAMLQKAKAGQAKSIRPITPPGGQTQPIGQIPTPRPIG